MKSKGRDEKIADRETMTLVTDMQEQGEDKEEMEEEHTVLEPEADIRDTDKRAEDMMRAMIRAELQPSFIEISDTEVEEPPDHQQMGKVMEKLFETGSQLEHNRCTRRRSSHQLNQTRRTVMIPLKEHILEDHSLHPSTMVVYQWKTTRDTALPPTGIRGGEHEEMFVVRYEQERRWTGIRIAR